MQYAKENYKRNESGTTCLLFRTRRHHRTHNGICQERIHIICWVKMKKELGKNSCNMPRRITKKIQQIRTRNYNRKRYDTIESPVNTIRK